MLSAQIRISLVSAHILFSLRSALHLFLHELQCPAARPPSFIPPHAHVYSRLHTPELSIRGSVVMVDYRAPHYQFPQRKPLGSFYPPQVGPTKNLSINSNFALVANPYSPQSVSPQGLYSHTRRRTSSSGALPVDNYPANYNTNTNTNPNFPPVAYLNRRSGSGSSSNTSTGRNGGKMDSTVPITLRRSGSTHTASSIATTSSNAYVTYLRRQKATVWCDKSQYEDPRLLAAQRAAKLRAAIEVVGSSTSAFLSSGHHGHGLGSGTGSAASSLNGGRSGKLGRSSNHVTSSVKKAWVGTTSPGIAGLPRGVPDRLPDRLSATEVLGDEDEDETFITGPGMTRRSGSGKSSLNSNHRKTNRSSSIRSDTNRASSAYGTGSGGLQHRNSNGSTSNYSATSSIADGRMKTKRSGSASPPDRNHHDNSHYSVGTPRRDNTLKRKGSLNEEEVARTMTMSNVRLFVANPDV